MRNKTELSVSPVDWNAIQSQVAQDVKQNETDQINPEAMRQDERQKYADQL